MPNTQFYELNYPEENEDPHFEKLASFFQSTENRIFSLENAKNNVIIPPDDLAWNSSTKTLSWTGYFELVLLHSGFSVKIPFGPDGVNSSVSFVDGERLVVVLPLTSSGEVSVNFKKSSGVQNLEEGLLVVGFCRGTKFYANLPQVYT